MRVFHASVLPSALASPAGQPHALTRISAPFTTRRRQEESVDHRDRRTRGLATQDGKFMPEHNDFEFFEVVRATT
jgi:hypothetical protein